MHIPKTAGTSLRIIMETNLGKGKVFPNSDFLEKSGGYPPLSTISDFTESIKSSSFFLGHYPFRFVAKKFPEFNCITFLRDPIERTISHLRHLKIHNNDYYGLSLHQIFKHRKLFSQFDNLQVRYLLKRNVIKNIQESDFQNAFQNSRKFAFIGISEKFDEEILSLSKLLEIKVNKRFKLNVFKDKELSVNLDEFFPSEDLINEIKECNQYDLRLYNLYSNK